MRVLHFYKASFPSSMGGVERFVDQPSRYYSLSFSLAFYGFSALCLSHQKAYYRYLPLRYYPAETSS